MTICEKCKSSMVIIKSNTGAKHCMNCGWCSDDNSYKKTQTNADYIRAMIDNDEKLAEFLDNNFCHRYCCGEREKQATLDWLREEVE